MISKHLFIGHFLVVRESWKQKNRPHAALIERNSTGVQVIY
ncbi:hypothetical protein SAMN05192533_101508 [Mesobacillus persicus]|uniref:Uncharacterized protein n=1 Tax=Mesobacillus persicus TaxID=930146 RepID=A0A1H7WP13_9BACI|nr:hypothetical protein SAMN05192533_101508 [Mesobacillus persicus]